MLAELLALWPAFVIAAVLLVATQAGSMFFTKHPDKLDWF